MRLASQPALPFKECPACGQRAVLSMDVCRRCGYRYPVGRGTAACPPRAAVPTAPARELASRGDTRSTRSTAIALGLLILLAVVTVTVARSGRRIARQGAELKPGIAGRSDLLSTAIGSRQIDDRLLATSASVGGDLEVILAWNSTTDLDLAVRDPRGEVVWANHPRSSSGGVQDVDANPTPMTPDGADRWARGEIPGASTALPLPDEFWDFFSRTPMPSESGKCASLYTRTPVEHIYFTKAPDGTYTVYTSCFWWRERTRDPLPFTVEGGRAGE